MGDGMAAFFQIDFPDAPSVQRVLAIYKTLYQYMNFFVFLFDMRAPRTADEFKSPLVWTCVVRDEVGR